MMNPGGKFVPPVPKTAVPQLVLLPSPPTNVTVASSASSIVLQSPVSLRMARSTATPSAVAATLVATAVQTPSASAGGGVDFVSGMTM